MKILFRVVFFVFVFQLALLVPKSSAEIVISEWSLGTGVSDFNQSLYPFSVFTDVENPFHDSHSTLLVGSFSSAAYDMGWLLDEAHFDVAMTHHIEQLDGSTSSSGRIYLTPAVDSIITLSGTWHFAWPASVIGATLLSMQVADVETEEPVARVLANGGNVGLDPPFGSFNLSDSGVLYAGHSYMLLYAADVHHFDPTPPGTYGEASGNIHFAITPIPEPTSLALLAFASLALPRRISRRRPRSA